MMKKIFSFLLIVIAALSGCDKIEGPVREPVTPSPTGPVTVDSVRQRKLLVEDYTGHLCGNCPEAADSLDSYIHRYEGKVVPLAIHAGYFARTLSPNYTYDFRTPAGTELDNFFGIGNAGNPNGMVNRTGYPGNTHIVAFTAWDDSIYAKLQRPAEAFIKISSTYNETSRAISCTTDVEILKDMSEDLKLCVFLTEDSIINYQKDYTQTPEDIPNYVFMHVFRASLNGTWGESINNGAPVTNKQVLSKSYNYTIPAAINDKQSHLVAFVYRSSTLEVLQAEIRKVR